MQAIVVWFGIAIVGTTRVLPQRECADAQRSLSSNEANTFAAAAYWFTALGLSRIRARASVA